jgi:hypothetical protein
VSTAEATTGAATWQDPAWRTAALDWAVERLAERGMPLTGTAEQPHVRAWSTAFRLPVAGGAVWVKSVGPGSAQEPALVGALGRWVPDRVLAPLAVHRELRLILLPDGGDTMRAAGRSASPEAWAVMLADYARLQLELIAHAEDMVGLGVPDLRPERLPALAAGLLDDDAALLIGHADGLAPEVRDRLRADLAHYAQLCRRLAESGIPATLQHDDLHDANVFVGDGRHRFFDWGDACVGHPFLSLLVPLRIAAGALGVPDGTPCWPTCGTPTSSPGRRTAAGTCSASSATSPWLWLRCPGRSPGSGSWTACTRWSGSSGRTPCRGGSPSTSSAAA